MRKFVVAVLLHPSTLLIAASSALIHWAVDLETMSKSSLNIMPEVQRLSTVPMVFLSVIITFRTQACDGGRAAACGALCSLPASTSHSNAVGGLAMAHSSAAWFI